MTDNYDPAKDGAESHNAAIKAIRMQKIRDGEIIPIVREVTIGDCRLIQGDSEEVLETIHGYDAILSDPPYGIEGSWEGGNSHGWGKFRGQAKKWDIRPEWFGVFVAGNKIPSIVWGGQYFSALPASGSWLIWDKIQRGVSFGEAELAWTNLGKPIRAFNFGAAAIIAENKQHPTQKPIPLMKWCLGFLPDAKTILDPFMGSGTTLVACAKMGRSGIGIELDPDYFDIACERVRKAYEQPDFFVASPEPKPVQEELL